MTIIQLVELTIRNHSGMPFEDAFYENVVKRKILALPVPYGALLELDEFNSKSAAFQRGFAHGDCSYGRKAALCDARYPELNGYLNAIYEIRLEAL